MLPTTCLSYFL